MFIAPNITITPLDTGSLDFAVNLLCSQLPSHAQELGAINESPSECYTHSLGKCSADPVLRAQAESWALKCRIDLDRLCYFVAIDTDTGARVGVSGIYSVLPGYLEREVGCVISIAGELETNEVFWMGWTAVVNPMKGRGIGTRLMCHGINMAQAIASKEKIVKPVWAILADVNAIGFYLKQGFTKLSPHGSGMIFTDRLEVAATLTQGSSRV